ncbi:MAG TPA: SLC13 family permease [Halobacteriales archaeon]|nr:SLC13 family permease [Halobacteriales archaeon]
MDRSWLALPVAVVVGAATYLYAPLPADQATVLSITLFSIVLWIGNPVPPWFTGVACIGLLGVAYGTGTALTGFSQPALWLIVFGLVVGEVTRRSGLVDVVERWTLSRLSGETLDRPVRLYAWLLLGLSLVGLGLVLLVPSGLVRVLILAPVLIEVGDRFDSREASLGLFLAPTFSTYYGSAGVLTGGLPNIVIVGVAESVAGQSIGWAEWFVTMFPIMGIGKALVIVATVFVLYRPDPDTAIRAGVGERAGDAAGARRMLLFLLVGVAFWATDFVHGYHPMYGALLVAVLALLPRIGVADLDAVGDVDFSIVFFVGAVFAIAAGLSETGFTDVAATWLLSFVPADAPLPLALVAVFGVTIAMTLVLEGVATSSVLTPVLVSFVESAGLPLLPVLFVEAIALETYFFPYQSIVLVTILGLDVVGPRELIRATTVISIVGTVTLLPLQILLFL